MFQVRRTLIGNMNAANHGVDPKIKTKEVTPVKEVKEAKAIKEKTKIKPEEKDLEEKDLNKLIERIRPLCSMCHFLLSRTICVHDVFECSNCMMYLELGPPGPL